MSILTMCQDAFSKGGTLAGVILSVVVGILALFEGPYQSVMSYVGVHNQVRDSKNGNDGFAASGDGRGIYMCDPKDILSMLALHLPYFLVCSLMWDFMTKFLMGKFASPARFIRFRCHSTSALILVSCLVCDTFIMTKEGYWTATPLWWNGLPQGHMPYFVKCYFLAQLAVLFFWLETLFCSGQNFASIRDETFHGISNLVFCIFCYIFNFGPLMMVTFFVHFGLELFLSFMHLTSFADMSGKLGQFVRFVSHAHRCLSVQELIGFVILALATITQGNRAVHEKALIATLIGTLFAGNVFRLINGRKYELDGLQTWTAGQAPTASGSAATGSGDPASAARGKGSRSKSKSRK